MKIAMIGTRGVPANYGGFETCVEELGKRLVQKGHEITVYCRTGYHATRRTDYLGMQLVHLPHLRMKSLDTLSHTVLSVLHALSRSYDVLMVFNAANSPALVLPRVLGRKIALNTDGLEWKRGKWGRIGRNYYKFAEWLSTKVAHRIVADSPGIQEYYRRSYNTEGVCIAYGAYPAESRKPELLERFGVEPGGYFLQITRFEPENNPLLTLRAFQGLATDKKLVLVGGVPYESPYSRCIWRERGPNVVLPGYVYEQDLLNELWCNCHAYIHGNEVGGTNPALLQAMAGGCFVLARDVIFNRDVLHDCGLYYGKDDDRELTSLMQWTLDHAGELDGYRTGARHRIQQQFTWERIAEEYETLFNGLCALRKR